MARRPPAQPLSNITPATYLYGHIWRPVFGGYSKAYPLGSGCLRCSERGPCGGRCVSIMPARWKSDLPLSRQEFEACICDDAACGAVSRRAAVASALGLPRLRLSQRLGTEPGSAGLGVRGLSAADFGDGGNDPAVQPPFAEDLIRCCPPSCQPFQWHVGAVASGAARAGQRQDRLAPAPQAAPGDG